MLMAALVLVVACLNLANLLLARGAAAGARDRHPPGAGRRTGAHRSAAVDRGSLALVGAAAGRAHIAWWSTRALAAWLASVLPLGIEVVVEPGRRGCSVAAIALAIFSTDRVRAGAGVVTVAADRDGRFEGRARTIRAPVPERAPSSSCVAAGRVARARRRWRALHARRDQGGGRHTWILARAAAGRRPRSGPCRILRSAEPVKAMPRVLRRIRALPGSSERASHRWCRSANSARAAAPTCRRRRRGRGRLHDHRRRRLFRDARPADPARAWNSRPARTRIPPGWHPHSSTIASPASLFENDDPLVDRWWSPRHGPEHRNRPGRRRGASVKQDIFDPDPPPHLYASVRFALPRRHVLHVAAAPGQDETALLGAIRRELRQMDSRLPVLSARR